jgi:hypothetical protein
MAYTWDLKIYRNNSYESWIESDKEIRSSTWKNLNRHVTEIWQANPSDDAKKDAQEVFDDYVAEHPHVSYYGQVTEYYNGEDEAVEKSKIYYINKLSNK